jgi:2,4-dienoyl-CoA reductase (NADPH2)
VTLYDRDSTIGGQFHMAKRIPGKEEFHETLRYFRTMLEKHGVKIELNTEMTFDKMKELGNDKWIVATGVTPRDPKIPGQDHPNVLSYIDVLKHKKPVGKSVAIIGAGGIGFDVGEYLLHYDGTDKTADEMDGPAFWKEWGIDSTLKEVGGLVPPEIHKPERQLYLLQRKKGKLGRDLGKTTGWIHRATLNRSKAVEMVHSVTYEKIDEKGHLHIKQDGKPRVLEVDNIIICAGQVEQHELEKVADGRLQVYTIGGAYAAGELDAKTAIDMGVRLAVRIHEPAVVPGKHVFATEPVLEQKMFKLMRKFM